MAHPPDSGAGPAFGGLESELRFDPLTGARALIVASRQARPNLPSGGCPFCPGGLEAPEPYEVRWFKNRWPPLPEGRAEIVLFSPEHHQSLGWLPKGQLLKVVSLWAERTQALGARDDVGYVLVFENRGRDVGATIPHPHGQIYAFSEVPPVPLRELAGKECAICAEMAGTGDAGPSHAKRSITSAGGWRSWAVWAAGFPFELLLAPEEHTGDLAQAQGSHEGLAEVLGSALSGLDGLFGVPMPYMLWCHQRPTDGGDWPTAHLHFHVAPAQRARRVPRYVASGELGTGIMFNPVAPEDAAARLRDVLGAP
jgi:UDPglucose--hexose-1-phosphate uridylyltransferase